MKVPKHLLTPKVHKAETQAQKLRFLKELARYMDVDVQTIAMSEDGHIHYYHYKPQDTNTQ